METKQNDALWKTINYIAFMHNESCSCLARKCGLDANIFNISKRKSKYGQPRWLSTKTIATILESTNMTFIEFAQIYQSFLDQIDQQTYIPPRIKPTPPTNQNT